MSKLKPWNEICPSFHHGLIVLLQLIYHLTASSFKLFYYYNFKKKIFPSWPTFTSDCNNHLNQWQISGADRRLRRLKWFAAASLCEPAQSFCGLLAQKLICIISGSAVCEHPATVKSFPAAVPLWHKLRLLLRRENSGRFARRHRTNS